VVGEHDKDEHAKKELAIILRRYIHIFWLLDIKTHID
jgi:hypothetical protein